METPASVRLTVRPLDWATSIDLADAYFHILIHPSFRKWLRFSHRSQVYQFRALPFGLSLAPWVFTRVIRDFVAALRLQGLRLSAYLDDWLLLASSRALCHQQTQHALQLALSLGFLPNFPKSELLPSQTFTFLGMFFQTVPYSVRPSSERLDRLRSLLDSFQGTHASARRLAALLGVMESLALLLPLGRLHKRQFQREFRRRWSQISAAWDARVPLLPWFHASVLQWQNTRWLLQGVPLTLPAPEATLFTDASHQGWGAHVEDLTSAGSWSPSLQSSHINMLELLAVHHAVLAFDAVLSGKHVLLCTDNTMVACYVNKQGGGTFGLALAGDGGSPSSLPVTFDHPLCTACTRSPQHRGRCPQPPPLGAPHRMDPLAPSSASSVALVVQANDRPLCHTVQPPPADLCLARARPSVLGDRLSDASMDRPSGVCVPPLPHSREGSPQSQSRSSPHDPHCSSLAGSTVVPGPAGTVPRRTSASRDRPTRSRPTTVRHSTRQSRHAAPSRVASVRSALRALGASSPLRSLIPDSVRPSTNAVYASHWRRWFTWCTDNTISPTHPSRVEFANFLVFLAQSLGLSSSSVRVCRAAVSTTLRQMGRHNTFSDDSFLSDVTRALSLRESRIPRRAPAWDLFIVLDALRRPPFEPLSETSLKALTQKACFLVMLASARRASDIHGLSGLAADIAHESDGSTTLRFLPEFLAKNQRPGEVLTPIHLRPLTSILAPDDIDRFLCPVRALRAYLRRSRPLRSPQHRRLFVSFNPEFKRDITKATLSRWIAATIKDAYRAFDISLPTGNPRAHEVRALSASMAASHRLPLHAILEAAFWRSEDSFINFYLRDTAHLRDDGSRGIGAVVVAQHVFSSHSQQ